MYTPPFHHIALEETDSTNRYLNQICNEQPELVPEFTTVCARFQTAGKGQRGNSWESEKDKNLLFSVVIYPDFLEAKRQFILSQIVSLAIKEELDNWTRDISIKWPNDIYYKEKKICGILIENDLKGYYLGRCICGIGLNINQEHFFSDAPNPISLKQITGTEHDCKDLLARIIQRLQNYYYNLKSHQFEPFAEEINRRYADALFRRQGLHVYEDKQGQFRAKLLRVEPDGRFVLTDEHGAIRSYLFKEVQYIL